MSDVKYRNLEALRKANGMTVEELMSKVGGFDRTTYYRVWQSVPNGNIRNSELVKLHEIFNVSTDCILGLKSLQITE